MKHKLSNNSHPVDFMAVFLPLEINLYSTPNIERPSFQMLAGWTNLKTIPAGVGLNGTCYKDYKPFNAHEIQQHLGLYILNGLDPAQEWKINCILRDKMRCTETIFAAAPLVQMQRKDIATTKFFACQNPAIETPS